MFTVISKASMTIHGFSHGLSNAKYVTACRDLCEF